MKPTNTTLGPGLGESFHAARRRAEWHREVAELRVILLVHAAALAGNTHQQIADHLGLTQSGVSRMLAKVSRTAVRDIPRQTLIPAADAAVEWLAASRGFGSVRLAERCWFPEPYEDPIWLPPMLTPEQLRYWSEPMIDVYLVVPERLGNGDVLNLEGDIARLLRRGLILHCTYLGARWQPLKGLYCAEPPTGTCPPADAEGPAAIEGHRTPKAS